MRLLQTSVRFLIPQSTSTSLLHDSQEYHYHTAEFRYSGPISLGGSVKTGHCTYKATTPCIRLIACSRCVEPSIQWCGYRYNTSLLRTVISPGSIIKDLLTSSCEGNFYRARFEINSPSIHPLNCLATASASLGALKLKILDRRHFFLKEHSP